MRQCKKSGYVLMSPEKSDGAHAVIAVLDAGANALAITNIVDNDETPDSNILVTVSGVATVDAGGDSGFTAPQISITGS